MVTLFSKEFESYKSDMRSGGLDEGVTHSDEKIRQLLEADQRNRLASLCSGKGIILSKRELEKTLELMAEVHKEVKEVDG